MVEFKLYDVLVKETNLLFADLSLCTSSFLCLAENLYVKAKY